MTSERNQTVATTKLQHQTLHPTADQQLKWQLKRLEDSAINNNISTKLQHMISTP
jgi:hypothetical protein